MESNAQKRVRHKDRLESLRIISEQLRSERTARAALLQQLADEERRQRLEESLAQKRESRRSRHQQTRAVKQQLEDNGHLVTSTIDRMQTPDSESFPSIARLVTLQSRRPHGVQKRASIPPPTVSQRPHRLLRGSPSPRRRRQAEESIVNRTAVLPPLPTCAATTEKKIKQRYETSPKPHRSSKETALIRRVVAIANNRAVSSSSKHREPTTPTEKERATQYLFRFRTSSAAASRCAREWLHEFGHKVSPEARPQTVARSLFQQKEDSGELERNVEFGARPVSEQRHNRTATPGSAAHIVGFTDDSEFEMQGIVPFDDIGHDSDSMSSSDADRSGDPDERPKSNDDEQATVQDPEADEKATAEAKADQDAEAYEKATMQDAEAYEKATMEGADVDGEKAAVDGEQDEQEGNRDQQHQNSKAAEHIQNHAAKVIQHWWKRSSSSQSPIHQSGDTTSTVCDESPVVANTDIPLTILASIVSAQRAVRLKTGFTLPALASVVAVQRRSRAHGVETGQSVLLRVSARVMRHVIALQRFWRRIGRYRRQQSRRRPLLSGMPVTVSVLLRIIKLQRWWKSFGRLAMRIHQRSRRRPTIGGIPVTAKTFRLIIRIQRWWKSKFARSVREVQRRRHLKPVILGKPLSIRTLSLIIRLQRWWRSFGRVVKRVQH